MIQEGIFKTKTASILQCEATGSFVLRFDPDQINFKFCDLYALRKKVMDLDIVGLLDSSSPDVEIIYLPHCDRFLVLTIFGVLEFRELLNGTFDTLALNSEVQKILRRKLFSY